METTLGLTCISEELKEKDKKVYSFRTMTRKRFLDLSERLGRDEAIKELCIRINHNLIVTQHIIRHCGDNNIKHYRISSALFPLVTDPILGLNFNSLPNERKMIEELRMIGILFMSYGMSTSIHPDQFNVLASLKEDSVNQTIKELNFQSMILDYMGLPQDHSCPMNIHINCSFPSPSKSLSSLNVDPEIRENFLMSEIADRFYNNLMRCDSGVYNRLTIENEDKGQWNVDNILKFSDYIFNKYKFNLPVCYDNLHDICNPSEVINISWQAERCAYTWVNQDSTLLDESNFIAPVFHWSEGKNDGTKNPRAHGDYFSYRNFPPTIAIEPSKEAKWECEVKAKDKAIRKLLNDFF